MYYSNILAHRNLLNLNNFANMLHIAVVLVNITKKHSLHSDQIILDVYMNLGMTIKICSNIQIPNSPSDPFPKFWNSLSLNIVLFQKDIYIIKQTDSV